MPIRMSAYRANVLVAVFFCACSAAIVVLAYDSATAALAIGLCGIFAGMFAQAAGDGCSVERIARRVQAQLLEDIHAQRKAMPAQDPIDNVIDFQSWIEGAKAHDPGAINKCRLVVEGCGRIAPTEVIISMCDTFLAARIAELKEQKERRSGKY